MNLTQLVRCGVAYSLGTRVWEDGRCPMITFHRRTVSISGVYSDIPSTLLPESFWKVIEGRLTKAIRQARRKRQVKRILPNMG